MNPVEHYPEEKKKIENFQEKREAERQEKLDIAEAYLKGQETGDMSWEKILKHYMKKYYRDFLDNPLTESMTKEERYYLLKELIYKHEILHEGEEDMGAEKAA